MFAFCFVQSVLTVESTVVPTIVSTVVLSVVLTIVPFLFQIRL